MAKNPDAALPERPRAGHRRPPRPDHRAPTHPAQRPYPEWRPDPARTGATTTRLPDPEPAAFTPTATADPAVPAADTTAPTSAGTAAPTPDGPDRRDRRSRRHRGRCRRVRHFPTATATFAHSADSDRATPSAVGANRPTVLRANRATVLRANRATRTAVAAARRHIPVLQDVVGNQLSGHYAAGHLPDVCPWKGNNQRLHVYRSRARG